MYSCTLHKVRGYMALLPTYGPCSVENFVQTNPACQSSEFEVSNVILNSVTIIRIRDIYFWFHWVHVTPFYGSMT